MDRGPGQGPVFARPVEVGAMMTGAPFSSVVLVFRQTVEMSSPDLTTWPVWRLTRACAASPHSPPAGKGGDGLVNGGGHVD